jgi:hypothetical protein
MNCQGTKDGKNEATQVGCTETTRKEGNTTKISEKNQREKERTQRRRRKCGGKLEEDRVGNKRSSR